MLYTVRKRVNPFEEGNEKYYASPSYVGEVTVRSLAEEINKTSSLSTGDVLSVLENLLQLLPAHLMNGNTIRLADFCSLKLSFSSEGQRDKSLVSADDIKKTKIIITPSVELKKKIASVKFQKR